MHDHAITAPATEDAKAWSGYGTALKPALEPIVLARKPLSEASVAANVLAHATGAINVDACRIAFVDEGDRAAAAAAEQRSRQSAGRSFEGWGMNQQHLSAADYAAGPGGKGRWPANVVHDGSDDVVDQFPESDGQRAPTSTAERTRGNVYGERGPSRAMEPRGDAGSAARFFYTAKADADDRLGSKHPTVKPIDLMRWLVRLVTPKGGLVLDPFAGTGTTGIAALAEGMRAVLIEREENFVADIRLRLAHANGEAAHSGSLKSRNKEQPKAVLPLFGTPASSSEAVGE